MVQKISPFLGTKYGWDEGESGWNVGMDENILAFSSLIDGNIDRVVDTLPQPINGAVYYLTTDQKIYYVVDSTYYSSRLPRWFRLRERLTGNLFLFNGTSLEVLPNELQVSSELNNINKLIDGLGSAAYKDVSDFLTSGDLIVDGSSEIGYRLNPDIQSRVLSEKLKESISVLDFGVIGDGLTDCTENFQKAIDYATENNKVLYIPGAESSYLIGHINLTCSLLGEKNSSLARLGASLSWIDVTNNNISISHLTFFGNSQVGDGVQFLNVSDCTFENNSLSGISGYAIKFNGCSNLKILSNSLRNCYNGISNILPEDSEEAVVSKNISVINNNITNLEGTAVYFSGKLSTSDSNYHFNNPLIADGVIESNNISNVKGHGILCQGRRVSIVGNQVISTGNAPGLQSIVPQGDMITVSANVCEGGRGVGIDMGGCTNSTVVGNSVRSQGEIGIEIQSCRNVTCVGNVVDSCGGSVSGTNSAGISVSQGYFGASFISNAVSVIGNTISVGPTGGRFGISVDAGVRNAIVIGNFLANSGTEAPIYLGSSTNSSALIFGNILQPLDENSVTAYGGTPIFKSVSPSGNADFWVQPQGSGQLRISKYMGTSTNPSNFRANSYLPIKDQDGNLFYIPLTSSLW